MKFTAENSPLIIGVLVGILVMLRTDSLGWGIAACVAAYGLGYLLIKLLEKAISKGFDALMEGVVDLVESIARRRKAKKENGEGKKP